MLMYRTLGRMFPSSFTAKVFFLAFAGTHVPLIALVAYVLGDGHGLAEQADMLGLVLMATLAGSGATLAALQAILRPLYRIEEAMHQFEQTGAPVDLPVDQRDELGRLMQHTMRLMVRLRARLDESQRNADTDPLTGVLNRRGFDRAVPDRGEGAILLFDLDHFKSINDRFGHDAGDSVLRAVAAVALRDLRRGDVLARFGGEEFVIWLPCVTAAQAQAAADRLCARIAAEVATPAGPVTASVGVAAGEGPLAALIARADSATYGAKRDGRNCVRVALLAA